MQNEAQSQFYKLNNGALKRSCDPKDLVVKMCSKFFCNSTNKLSDKDIDKLIDCPKVKIENFKRKGKLMNLSMEFNRANKNSKVYFSSNIEYYASVVDGKVQLFAVTYTKRQGVNSIALTYIPEGNLDESIFLARVAIIQMSTEIRQIPQLYLLKLSIFIRQVKNITLLLMKEKRANRLSQLQNITHTQMQLLLTRMKVSMWLVKDFSNSVIEQLICIKEKT